MDGLLEPDDRATNRFCAPGRGRVYKGAIRGKQIGNPGKSGKYGAVSEECHERRGSSRSHRERGFSWERNNVR